jgi:hypothetical protein
LQLRRGSTCATLGSSRFLGQLSCLRQCETTKNEQEIFKQTQTFPCFPFDEIEENLFVGPKMHEFLLGIYFSEIHPLYPFLDESLPFLSFEQSVQHDHTAVDIFILQLVYANACHCVPGDKGQLLALGAACHGRALARIDNATADGNVITLQAITLLALHSLFEPQKGNFGQLIGFAARLAIDIGAHDAPSQEARMQDIHAAIYCMENHYASTLDRPSFLPEPVSSILPVSIVPNVILDTTHQL